MYEDDYVLRQIRQLGQAIARLLRGETVDRQELDAAARAAFGLDLPTIDALPLEALLALAPPGDDLGVERLLALAALLEATAEAGATGDVPRERARQIRERVH